MPYTHVVYYAELAGVQEGRNAGISHGRREHGGSHAL